MKNNIRVLIVEDSRTQAEKLKYILENNNYKVIHASDANKAIEFLNKSLPDIIISDVMMPGKNGYELCKDIKSNNIYKNIPVILLTSLSDPTDVIKGLNCGADSFITKPYSEKFLLTKIEYLIMNFNIRKNHTTDIDLEVFFAGKKHIISSSRLQIVDLLFSTYENAVIKNEELAKANNELKLAQTQLLHAKKMASLGVLTAGIAHEINNPINFIYSGINSLEQDFTDILPFLQTCKKALNGKIEYLEKLRDVKENIDFDDILKAIPQTIEDIKYGAQRTTEIIKGLRNFSRMDVTSKQAFDIHEGINSTLLLLKNKYDSNNIEIIKKFDEKISKIQAFGGELNQVFMNLICNAIDAINSRQSTENNNIYGTIKIITNQTAENLIYISISDNGSGISKKIQDKIFDPFFTTKDVGAGTGLGLAISHGIIKKHNGEISMVSKIGEGSKFIIKLPNVIRETI